ncbi:MAG: glucose-methanol-choline oxidoreductase [Microbacteriaceae bacterium]|nr:glucose-methanol-choline oxidoreductase [Microbacteriaceae bacterium]
MINRDVKSLQRKPDVVDVVIVGMGASGGTAAKVLSEAGLTVVGLDRGPWLSPQTHFSGDELKFLNRDYLGPDPALNPRTVRHDLNSKAEITSFSPVPQLVGGGTVHWAGWVPRPMPSDFKQRSLHGDIEGASLVDWPITYDELEPYLSKIEWEFGCAGLARSNKFEPPRSREYPMPPLPPTAFAAKFYEGCERLGINAYPFPIALASTSYKGREPANHTGFWNQFGDPTLMRSTTLTSFIPDALSTGRFELRPDCYVREVTVGSEGRAKGVVYVDAEGNEFEQEAKAVVLCLGAIESARLMLMSKSRYFPEGLANSSGYLGKNATFHETMWTVGLFDKDLHDPLYGYSGHQMNGGSFEFYETDESRGHIGGSVIASCTVAQPINWLHPGRPMWGQAGKDADRDFYNHAMAVELILHDMPQETNQVDLDPEVTDGWGLPVARITHKPHENDIRLATWQTNKNMEILEAAGAYRVLPTHLEKSTGNSFHQHGTARMGDNWSTSVLNEWCQAHDVDNLFVMDGSFFPTSTGVNPTLTIMAQAWRASEYLANIYARGRAE